MLRLKHIVVIPLLFLCSFSGFTQKKSLFAVGLIPSAGSQILTFAIVTKIGDRYVGTQIIGEQYFMYYALGYWPCKANANRENLFKKNNVPNCHLLYSSSGKVNGYHRGPFDELWKIKYKLHPQNRNSPEGWSNEYYKPSPGQAKYLYENYGVLNINTHYFVGESLFQLLRDVQDPEWIKMYQSLTE